MSTNFDRDDSRAKVARKRKWRTFRVKHAKLLRLNSFDKQGVAFVLTLAVGIVGVSAAWYTGQRLKDRETMPLEDSYQMEQAQQVPQEDDALQTFEESPIISSLDENGQETAISPQEQAQEASTPSITAQDVLSRFQDPVQGKIVTEFSIDTLLYNDTLGQWCTHNGVDYAADEGTRVMAALDGVVESVTHDPLLGHVITLAHDCGIKSIYAGLGSVEDTVAQGVRFAAGNPIGTVGTSAAFEAHLGAHLHFELLTADGYVDPHAASNT